MKGTINNEKSNVCKNNGQFNFMACLYLKCEAASQFIDILMFIETR